MLNTFYVFFLIKRRELACGFRGHATNLGIQKGHWPQFSDNYILPRNGFGYGGGTRFLWRIYELHGGLLKTLYPVKFPLLAISWCVWLYYLLANDRRDGE